MFFFSPGNLKAQTDYEFWFAAPEISYEYIAPSPFIYQGLDRPIRIYLTTADGPANFIIDQPANPAFTPITGIVKTDSTKQVDITAFIDIVENKPANTILNFGLRILSNKPITAYYEVQSLYNQETFVLKGRNALGYEFIVPSQSHFNNYVNCSPLARNSFIVVASEDSTLVTIIPSNYIEGHSKYDTIILELNQGQTWCARATGGDSTDHLGGSFVFADKPIAVTIADDEVMYPSTLYYSKDLAGDQLIPRNLCGTAYIADLTALPAPIGAKAMLYAFEDSTMVSINSGPNVRIDRGQVHEFKIFGPNFVCYITSSKPVLAYHFRGTMLYNWNFSGCIIPPLNNCSGSKRISICRTPPILPSSGYYLYFVTQNGNQGNFTVVGTPSFIIPATGWDTVPGTNSQWVFYGSAWANAGAQSYIISNSSGRFQMSSSTEIDEYFDKGNYYTDVSSLNLGPNRKICPGESLKLDAGYGWTSYLWNTGVISQSIEVINPGTYWVQVADGNCVLRDTIVVSYYWSQPVNIGPDRQICSGDSIQLNAGPGRTWYFWNTGDSTQSIWVKDAGNYWVRVQDVHCIVSDTVQVVTTLVPSLTNNPLSKTICSGEHTNIPLTSSNPNTLFYWAATLTSGVVTGFSADSGVMINQTLVNNGSTAGIVTYHITPKVGECIGSTVDFIVMVNVGDQVNVSIAASANNICDGTQVTFTSTPINPGSSPIYQWKVNAENAVNGNNAVFSYTPVNGDIVQCVLTSSNTICTSNNPATSNSVLMTVIPLQIVSVSVMPSANPVCAGSPVTFSTNPVNGGSTPHYQWIVNGLTVGTNSSVYSYVPANGDAITCTLTSNELCPSGNPALSNIVVMSVSPILTTGVAIAVSSNPFCAGSSVTFTATPANGGFAPIFQWKVNGVNSGTNSPVFDYIPVNGDIVTCSMVSSDACSTGNPAQSNPITMAVNANLPAGITIAASANPFCEGATVTYSATPVNGGSAPAYQWKVNAINAINANNAVFSFSPLPGDEVLCVVTSNLNCVTANPATSNIITMVVAIKPSVTFIACNDLITTVNAKPFKLKGGTPIGGVYSGSGVTSATGMFNPASAGTGIKTIQYSYTNVVTCSDFKTITITVQPAPAFICGNNLTDIRDGRQYTTFSLPNGKCWTSANLDFGFTIDDLTPQTDNCIPEKYTRPASLVPRPAFYQWDELMAYQTTEASQGLCPPGWHVPTSAEWNELLSYFNGAGQAGGPMKDTLLANSFQSHQQGFLYLNNTWAFTTGLYAGSMYWSSTLSGSSAPSGSRAIARGLNEYNPSVSKYEALRGNGFGVRCLKDY